MATTSSNGHVTLQHDAVDVHETMRPVAYPAETWRAGGLLGFVREWLPPQSTGGGPAGPLLGLAGLAAAWQIDVAARTALMPAARDFYGVAVADVLGFATLLPFVALLVAPFIGFVGDRNPRRLFVVLGSLALAVGLLGTAAAPTAGALFLARFVLGFGRITEPFELSLIADQTAPAGRMNAFGLRALLVAVGGFVGGGLGYLGRDLMPWQGMFLLAGGVGVVSAVLVLRGHEPARGTPERALVGAPTTGGDDPASWAASWRIAKGSFILRRAFWAAACAGAVVSQLGDATIGSFALRYGMGVSDRMLLHGFAYLAEAGALLVAVVVLARLLRYRTRFAPAGIGVPLGIAGVFVAVIGLAPWPALAGGALVGGRIAGAVVLPALFAVLSLLAPPRARTFVLALATLAAGVGGIAITTVAGLLGGTIAANANLVLVGLAAVGGGAAIASVGRALDRGVREALAAAVLSDDDDDDAPLLEARNVEAGYEGTQVLFGVDLEVPAGEIVAILGPNGAGKTTLLRVLSGTLGADRGVVRYDGHDVTHIPPAERAGDGIVYAPGDQGVFPSLSVDEHLRLAAHGVDTDGVAEVLDLFPQLRGRGSELAGNLSGGEQHMLTLAQALLARPRVLLLDELSLGLAPAVVQELLALVTTINKMGVTIVLVEQSVEKALAIAHRAVLIEKGSVRFSGPAAELAESPTLLRSLLLAVAPTARRRARTDDGAPPVLRVESVHKSFGGVRALAGAGFELHPKQVLGIIGANGAGKTTLFDAITGSFPLDAGRIELLGDDVTALPPEARARLGLQRSFQDARLFPGLTVRESLAVGLDRKLEVRSASLAALQLPSVRRAEKSIAQRVDRLIEMFHLGELQHRLVGELPSGTRRTVELAAAVASDPEVLLLDEPSAGMSDTEAEELIPLLERVRLEAGCSLVIIEHHLPLLTAVATDLVALHLGQVIAQGAPNDVLEDPAVVEAYLGGRDELTTTTPGTRPENR